MIIRISIKNKPEETRKALEKLARSRRKKKKKLADFYGKGKGIYGNAIDYQNEVRNEWA